MQTDETFVRMLAATPEVQLPKLYEIYHENTKMHPLVEARVVNVESNPNAALNRFTNQVAIAEIESTVATGGKKYRSATRHPLTHSLATIEDVSLTDVLTKRQSVREFGPEPVTLEQLAVLCKLTYGWNQERDVELDGGVISYRFVPSAGRLFPLELYLVTPQTPNYGKEDYCDIWHYEPNSHVIERIHCVKATDIRTAFVHFPATMPVVGLLTGVIPRLTWKYGDRAYRYAHLEAGHVGQNLVLAATALGLGSCPIVSFYDDAIHDILDVDGVSEIILYSFFIGHPDTNNSQV